MGIIEGFKRLVTTRYVNTVGQLILTMPMGTWQVEDFGKNQILEVWREKNGIVELQGETAYFLVAWDFYSSDGENLVDLIAYDAMSLLDAPIVAYPAGSAQAGMTGYADNLIKEVVRDNLGVDAIIARQLPRFTVAPNLSASVSLTKGFSWRNVLLVCQELADAATTKGVSTYFDVVRIAPATFELRTYTEQRGVDHNRYSSDPKLIGAQYGNLKNQHYMLDYSQERNYIYAGGQGEENARTMVEVWDDARIANSFPYNRKEFFVDARNCETVGEVTAEANAALNEGKPQTILSGELVETPGLQYGRDYGFGDKLSVEAFGHVIDCHVDSVGVVVDANNLEQITAELTGEI